MLFVSACSLQLSERSDFTRDVPAIEPGACRTEVLTWRATEVLVEAPEGLVAFQSLLSEAAGSDNLNFIITQASDELQPDLSPWPLAIGTADALGGGCYAPIPDFPMTPASAEVDTSGAERPFSAADLTFTVVAKLPFDVPLPLTAATVSAVADSQRENLRDGRVEGVILGEIAAATLLDLRGDGDPANFVPLTSFLGDTDLDVDGDGVVDDYSAAFGFSSEPVGLLE